MVFCLMLPSGMRMTQFKVLTDSMSPRTMSHKFLPQRLSLDEEEVTVTAIVSGLRVWETNP